MERHRTAYKNNGRKVNVRSEQEHERLRFWIAKANIVLQNFRAGVCQHESGKEHADEGKAYRVAL